MEYSVIELTLDGLMEKYAGRRTVLVYDGHPSRYPLRTVQLLMEHTTDLVILPSYSSYVTQLLDIGLKR